MGAVDTAARVRAARAWSGMDQKRLADELDISPATLRRIESAQRGVSRAELERIAKVTRTPAEFLYDGFATNPPQHGKNSADEHRDLLTEKGKLEIENERLREAVGTDTAQHVEQLARELAQARQENDRLRAAVVALAADPQEIARAVTMRAAAEAGDRAELEQSQPTPSARPA